VEKSKPILKKPLHSPPKLVKDSSKGHLPDYVLIELSNDQAQFLLEYRHSLKFEIIVDNPCYLRYYIDAG
jgi:hypothetical protein